MAKIREIIERVDLNKPNDYPEAVKLRWIALLDGKIATSVFLMDIAEAKRLAYTHPEDMETEPLVDFPYDDVYDLWLGAKIDFENGEYNKYQNAMEMFNSQYGDFVRWFADTYEPAQGLGYVCRENRYYISAYGLAVKHGFQGTEEEWVKALADARGSADKAEEARLAIENMTVKAKTLAPGAQATVEKLTENGVTQLEFGIPQGEQGGAGMKTEQHGEIFNDYENNTATGEHSSARNRKTSANGNYSDASGYSSFTAEGATASHVEGYFAEAHGVGSHAEGYKSKAYLKASHAEGSETEAAGEHSHSEGFRSKTKGLGSHAEGGKTEAQGAYSHAEGNEAIAKGEGSHTEGRWTIAHRAYQHVQGMYNEEDTNGLYAHIVGWGTSNTQRKNIHTIDTQGNADFAGVVRSGGKELATKESLKALTAKDVGATPAGYGLGNDFDEVTDKALLDTYYKTGWVRYNNYEYQSLIPGRKVYHAIIRVDSMTENEGQECCTQTGYVSYYGEYKGCVIQRTCHVGVWGEWEWVNPPVASGAAEYRTTQRYGQEPIYVRMFNTGILASNNLATITTDVPRSQIVKMEGFVTNPGGTDEYKYPLPMISSGEINAYLLAEDNKVHVKTLGGFDSLKWSARVTLWYIKNKAVEV